MKKATLYKVLVIAIAAFVLGLALAAGISTAGGKVEHRRLSVMTDRGVSISLDVYKPKAASQTNPLPAVMLIPGGNASVEYMSDACIDLARRGIIAIGIEPYTIGRSDVEKDNGGLGSIDVTKYVTQLAFVDQENIGYIGWSMGASRVTAALYINDPSGATVESTNPWTGAVTVSPKQIVRPGVKGAMFVGAGSLIDTSYGINSAVFEGEWDNLYRGDRREMYKNPQYARALGVEEFEFWKWYGDPTNGTGQIYYEGWTGHTAGLSSYSFVKAACDFYTTTFGLDNSAPILFLWKEFGTGLAFVAAVVVLIAVMMLLLQVEWFRKDLVCENRTIIQANPKKWYLWVGLLLPAFFGAATAAWAVPKGQGILNKWVSEDLIHGTNIQNVNGLVFWLCCLQLFGLVLWALVNFFLAKTDRKALKEQITLPGVKFINMFLKALLLSFLAIMAMYFLVSFGEQLFNISPRLWKVQINSLTPLRMGKFITYFPLYLIPFLFANYMHSTSYYSDEKPGLSTLMFWMANGLPPMFFLFYAYGKIAFLHTTPITSLGMSRANGSLVDATIMMVPVGIMASTLYKKTKNFYLPAIFNSMFFTWMAVATDLIYCGA